ncbi:alpha/beta fold hydrolase [Streptomyces sp. NPDC002643]
MLLHGWACGSHDWSRQIPGLLTHGYRVIALDHRGHGRSSAPRGDYPADPRRRRRGPARRAGHRTRRGGGPLHEQAHRVGTCSAQMVLPSVVWRVPQAAVSWATRSRPRPPSS